MLRMRKTSRTTSVGFRTVRPATSWRQSQQLPAQFITVRALRANEFSVTPSQPSQKNTSIKHVPRAPRAPRPRPPPPHDAPPAAEPPESPRPRPRPLSRRSRARRRLQPRLPRSGHQDARVGAFEHGGARVAHVGDSTRACAAHSRDCFFLLRRFVRCERQRTA